MSMRYRFIDVNGPSATLKVTVILNKRRYQSINQSRLSSSGIAVFDMSIVHRYSSQHTQDDDANH